jgi:MFS family permease
MGDDATAPAVGTWDAAPTRILTAAQLLQLAVYWYGLVSVFNGVNVVIQERMPSLVEARWVGLASGLVQVAGVAIAVLVQPTIGTISDYTTSRWGRRKPYIVIGTALDFLFILGLATSNTVLALAAFLALLQLSSNFAQGPFQGYLPDMVPPSQVGLASGLVGAMQVLGVVGGILTITVGRQIAGDYVAPTIALGLVELLTMVVLFVRLDEGRQAKPRRGRSWRSIALEAWGTDILADRSFLFLVASRFFILGGSSFLLAIPIRYFERSHGLGLDDRALWINLMTITVALTTVLATVPSARISDRVGRKPVIYAACLAGSVGMAVIGLAPAPPLALPGAILVGMGAGTFLAVDWALITDLIPKASAGRYMGISNVATATNGLAAAIVGGVFVDVFYGLGNPGAGPRAAYLSTIAIFGIGALLLRQVVEPRERAA